MIRERVNGDQGQVLHPSNINTNYGLLSLQLAVSLIIDPGVMNVILHRMPFN